MITRKIMLGKHNLIQSLKKYEKCKEAIAYEAIEWMLHERKLNPKPKSKYYLEREPFTRTTGVWLDLPDKVWSEIQAQRESTPFFIDVAIKEYRNAN